MTQEHIPAEKARAGSVSGRVRNVLVLSLGLSALALLVVAAYFMLL